jgi:hypothetical protein
VATRAFDARITAMFYERIRDRVDIRDCNAINRYIKSLGPQTFLTHVEEIRKLIFTREAQEPVESTSEGPSAVNHSLLAHCRFLCQMETYKSLKYAIKRGDIGLIKRVFPRCCLLFEGSNKKKYAFLSLYMTWLTHTEAATPELEKALLANGLVNLRGKDDSWFEMDRLNEFFNLEMREIMATRRSSTQDLIDLFHRVALTASYCSELKSALEMSFGGCSNGRHQVKDASEDVYRLAFHLSASRSVYNYSNGRDSGFKPRNIMNHIANELATQIEKFNSSQFGDDDLDNTVTTPIAALDDILDDDIEA